MLMKTAALRCLIICWLLLVTGCATRLGMPFSEKDQAPIDKEPIYLMTVSFKNQNMQKFQPEAQSVVMVKQEDNGKPVRRAYEMDKASFIRDQKTGEGKALIRLRASDAFNQLEYIGARSGLIGVFILPLYQEIGADAPGVYYLGHVDAVVRPRGDNEFRAGPLIPLLDQAIAGASTGTFDVKFIDLYDQDVPKFKTIYPALSQVSIIKKIMPPWDRDKAQKEWDR
jgi:hypothetical protein